MDTPTTMRINKALAAAGVCSRRRADELVAAGRVTVNGTVVVEQGYKIDPTSALLAVDGVPVALTPADAAPLTLMHHKKAGVVTTASDPDGRPTVLTICPSSGGPGGFFPWDGSTIFPKACCCSPPTANWPFAWPIPAGICPSGIRWPCAAG